MLLRDLAGCELLIDLIDHPANPVNDLSVTEELFVAAEQDLMLGGIGDGSLTVERDQRD